MFWLSFIDWIKCKVYKLHYSNWRLKTIPEPTSTRHIGMSETASEDINTMSKSKTWILLKLLRKKSYMSKWSKQWECFFLSSTRMQNIAKTAVKIYIFNGMMKDIRKAYYEDIIIFEST